MDKKVNRRNFIKKTAAAATGMAGLSILPNVGLPNNNAITDGIHIIGPGKDSRLKWGRFYP